MNAWAVRGATVLLASTTFGCASPPVAPPPVGVDLAAHAPCNDAAVVPQLVASSPAVLPPSVWERGAGWESRLRFRVGEDGTPSAIHASVEGRDGDTGDVERASVAAMSGYRFCRPVGFPVGREWSARMRFRYSRVGPAFGSGEMYHQLLIPAYTPDDVRESRSGRAVVSGVFDADGRPSTVRLITSSGDAALDRKSLESIASEQLVFGPGTSLTRPIVLARPYVYEIR